MSLSSSYTLLELCIVLWLISVLFFFGIPQIVLNEEHKILQELEKIETIFLFMHQRAIATQTTHELFIDTQSQSYQFITHNKPVSLRLTSGLVFDFIADVLGPPGDPKNPICTATTFPHTEKNDHLYIVKFFSNGQFYPGALYITDVNKRFMGALTCSISRVFYTRKYLLKFGHWQPQSVI